MITSADRPIRRGRMVRTDPQPCRRIRARFRYCALRVSRAAAARLRLLAATRRHSLVAVR